MKISKYKNSVFVVIRVLVPILSRLLYLRFISFSTKRNENPVLLIHPGQEILSRLFLKIMEQNEMLIQSGNFVNFSYGF